MTPSQRSSKPRFALAAAVAGASLLLGIAEARGAPATPRMNFAMEEIQEPLDPATVHFGEVIFDYYTGRNLDAVTKLLIARERRILSESEDYAEMLLGDLYTSFGLIDSAERIFAGLVNRDILPSTRNETWFHTAELRYHQGQLDEAARILEGRIDELPPKLEKSRLIILGNIYMSRGEFERAAELLGTVKGDDILGAYALYNAGVALIRADQVDRGMPFLVRVRDLPPGDEETNALKDRAAIAMGFTWLQRGDFDRARESLLTVRTDGPFTNQAMLGLGYANFQRNDFKRALPPWLELLQRNTSDTSVQEALLLAPRAYEELGAESQALFGYRYAADTLRDELKKVERTIIRIRSADWIDSLNPETQRDILNADPVAPVRAYTPASIPEAPYLYGLFASREFGEDYKLYLELKRIDRLLTHWQEQVPIFQAMLGQHRAILAPLRPRLDELITGAGARASELEATVPGIKRRIEQAIRDGDTEQTAALPQLAQLDTVRALDGLKPGGRDAERLRRARGLVLWDIAHAAPEQYLRVSEDIVQVTRDIDNARLHVDALKRLRTEIGIRMGDAYDRRLAAGADRLAALKAEVGERLRDQTLALQNRALAVLAENRRNLGAQLAETHLAIARLQDSSVSEVIEKSKER